MMVSNWLFNLYALLDVYLLDKTRVKVTINPDSDDYIHASFVEVSSELTYICAQGPLENTITQFWLMCVQEDVKVILQLCKFVEDGKEKCCNYLPSDSDTASFGCVEVKVGPVSCYIYRFLDYQAEHDRFGNRQGLQIYRAV
jgi:protein tyrosine phosphatase